MKTNDIDPHRYHHLERENSHYQKRLEAMSEMAIEMQQEISRLKAKVKDLTEINKQKTESINAMRMQMFDLMKEHLQPADMPTMSSRLDEADDSFKPEEGSPASERHLKAVMVVKDGEASYMQSVFDVSRAFKVPVNDIYALMAGKRSIQGLKVDYFHRSKFERKKFLTYESRSEAEIIKALEPLGELKR